jgi:hypothetical protein
MTDNDIVGFLYNYFDQIKLKRAYFRRDNVQLL